MEENPARQIGTEVAQELNQLFIVICGFTDRMLMKHGANASLRPELQLIAENVRRAERVLNQAVKVAQAAPHTGI